jgi:hypothetical protein
MDKALVYETRDSNGFGDALEVYGGTHSDKIYGICNHFRKKLPMVVHIT